MSFRVEELSMRPSRARRTLSTAVILIAAASLAGCAASNTAKAPASAAARPAGAAPAGAAGAAADKPMQEWKKITKDAEKIPGYLTLWKKRENLYLELPKEMLNVPVLGIFSFGRGIGDHGIFGGMPLNDRLIEFERHGDRILVL